MKVLCRVDGLAILKGGQGKATVYFDTKDATKAALDLNEHAVSMELAADPLPDESETIEAIEHRMTVAHAELAVCSRRLIEMARQGLSLFQEKEEGK